MIILTRDGPAEITVSDPKSKTELGRHWNAVRLFLDTGDDTEVRRFDGHTIADTKGRRVPLLTDLDELERLGAAGTLSFESIYAKIR
jgi:hypothetical protein